MHKIAGYFPDPDVRKGHEGLVCFQSIAFFKKSFIILAPIYKPGYDLSFSKSDGNIL